MGRFGQHTQLVAADGSEDELVAKFLEASAIQRDNPDCELMVVSRSPTDPRVVYLTEVWSTEEAWEAARRSDAIKEWSADMPRLVAGPTETTALMPIGGVGLQ